MNNTAQLLLILTLPYVGLMIKDKMIQLFQIIKQLFVIGCLSAMYWYEPLLAVLAVSVFGFWMQFQVFSTWNVFEYWRGLSLSTFALFCMTENICLSFAISFVTPLVGKMLLKAVARKGSKAD